MKKPIVIITILSVLLNIVVLYLFVIKGETVVSDDSRVALEMSDSNRDFVLEEMRDFLESVRKINEGILKEEPNLIIEAGKKSGGSVIDHAPKGLLKSLPIGFKELGFATHDIFDEIQKSAKNNFNPKESQSQLNILLNNCVACHQSYKIEIFQE